MGAGDINLVPAGPKDIRAGGGVAVEEGVAYAVGVAVGRAATADVKNCVGAEGPKGDEAIEVSF